VWGDLQPPVPLEARFSPDASSLYLVFDQPTNRAGQGSAQVPSGLPTPPPEFLSVSFSRCQASCAVALSDDTANLLAAECIWEGGGRMLRALLTVQSMVRPGDTIHVRDDVIAPASWTAGALAHPPSCAPHAQPSANLSERPRSCRLRQRHLRDGCRGHQR
jgi:hypothetical protein